MLNTPRINIYSGFPSASALPAGWGGAWGDPSPFHRRALASIRDAQADLADDLPLIDESPRLGDLVHAGDGTRLPIHRWYYYKEAFSPRLPAMLVGHLGVGSGGVVADVFSGVGTTALALRSDPRVARVIALEYSPFAHFVAGAKLTAHDLDPSRLRAMLADALRYDAASTPAIPALSSFQNPAIFAPAVLRDILKARDHLDGLDLSPDERSFFRLGLVAASEQLSGTIKDGRALRIVRRGHLKREPLAPRNAPPRSDSVVADALADRWSAMIEDVEAVRHLGARVEAPVLSLRGDARMIDAAELEDAFAPGSIGLFLGSPPYLNCIDYSEVYKLELWLLGLVSSQEEFRNLRLGTIRSHPSVEFPETPLPRALAGASVVRAIEEVSAFIEANHARGSVGRIVRQYFVDMAIVLEQQFRALEPGGHAALVVGNSTFSRRDKVGERREERWRIPLLSDVLIARLGEAIGFEGPEIWTARDLRARNVTAGSARESVVVFRKPGRGQPERRGEPQATISSYESVSR